VRCGIDDPVRFRRPGCADDAGRDRRDVLDVTNASHYQKETKMNRLTRLRPVLPILALAAAAPLGAQQGRDLLVPEEPLGALGEHSVRDVVIYEAGDISLVEAAVSDPTRVASAATTEYKYDDGDTHEASWLVANNEDVHEQEFAQRFRLSSSGTVSYVTLCVARREDAGSSNRLPFKITFYRDSGGRPGTELNAYDGRVTSPSSGAFECFKLTGVVAGQRLSDGDTWLGVSWQSSTGMGMMVDDRSIGSTKLSVRARVSANSNWIAWQDHPKASIKVFLIRLGVDHGGDTPPPPDPEPPPVEVAPCDAAGEGINLLGYQAFMCIVASGEVHQLLAQKLSDKVAVFGSRSDPKAMIKVVGGCTWGAIAAVTTARKLQIRVYNTANGNEWEHNHNRGGLAPSGYSGNALCDESDEDDASAPDLVVSSPSVSDGSPSAGGTFTLRATVRNQGDGRSASTTLRYYRSSDSGISISDTQVGTDAVSALSASTSSSESISLTAPSSAGTYYYGACVDSVSGESNTGNNCSSAVRVTVSGGGTSGTRYNVGDVITTLPSDSWSFNGALLACSFLISGGKTNVQCQRNGFVERLPYRYTCEASSCQIDGRSVTRGTWLETRR